MTRSDYNAMNEIREARQKAGITQKRAAEICGVPLRTYQDWEYGKRNPPEYVKVMIINKLMEECKMTNEITEEEIEDLSSCGIQDWIEERK